MEGARCRGWVQVTVSRSNLRDITHAEMDAAYDTGEAVPLGQAISWLAR